MMSLIGGLDNVAVVARLLLCPPHAGEDDQEIEDDVFRSCGQTARRGLGFEFNP